MVAFLELGGRAQFAAGTGLAAGAVSGEDRVAQVEEAGLLSIASDQYG